MAESEKYLKTQQVADALGMSVSTIKRWVDADRLKATRTIGRHRLIPLTEAIRFARENDLPQEQLRRLFQEPADRSPEAPIRRDLCDSLMTALRRGRARDAHDLILEAYASGSGAAALADDLIQPVLAHIGHDWEVGRLDVYQEHRASRIVESALMDLLRQLPPAPPSAPLALGATPEGDLYTLPGLLCELTLREQGWDAVNLGPNLPMDSFSKALRSQQPTLAWLSVHHLRDIEKFVEEYHAFYDTAARMGVAIALGGPALVPELRRRLVAASFGDRMAHLGAFARQLRPVAGGPGNRPMDRLDSSTR